MTDDFGKSLTASLLLHGCVLLVIFVRLLLAPEVPIEIRNSIRVDIVGLPDKVQELPPAPTVKPTLSPPVESAKSVEQKKLPVKETPKPEASKPVVNLKSKKADLAKNQKKALEQLKAMQALENIKSEVTEERKKAALAAIKGAEVSPGNSLTGLARLEYNRYYDQVEKHLRPNWNVPQWLAEAQLKARALVRIDENGNVLEKRLLNSSGNSVFDSTVLDAVEKSNPFPPPPETLRAKMKLEGFVFRFPEE